MVKALFLIGLICCSPSSGTAQENTKKIDLSLTLSEKDQVGLDTLESLVKAGLPPHVAAGFIGNISQESDFVPSVSGRSGIGLCQWCGYRKNNLKRFAAENRGSWTDATVQAKFIYFEIFHGTEKEILARLLRAKDVKEAATLVCWLYERPRRSTANLSFRISEARRFYSLWEKSWITRDTLSRSSLQK